MSENVHDWSPTTLRDFAALFCGKLIGTGMSREVFILETDPTKVVKIERDAGAFQNVREWQTWEALRYKPAGKFLAPCTQISPCGIVLIQERVEPLPKSRRKIKLPDFLCDFKASNYGLLKGRVVCVDYGTNLLFERYAERALKLRAPNEWYT